MEREGLTVPLTQPPNIPENQELIPTATPHLAPHPGYLIGSDRGQPFGVMAERTYLNRRPNGVYAVRIRIPDDLRSHPSMQGRKERWVELPTRDLAEANRLKLPIVARIKAEFDQLRQIIANAPLPNSDDLRWMAQDAYKSELAEDSALRRKDFAWATEFNSLIGPAYLQELKRQLATLDFTLVSDEVEREFRKLGFNPDPNSEAFKQACEFRLRTLIEVQTRKDERDRRDFDGSPRDSILRDSAKFGTPESRKPLSELLPMFHRERPTMKAATKDAQAAVIATLEEFLGHKKAVGAITKRDMIDFKNALGETPANRKKRFPGASIHEAIRLNRERGEDAYPPMDEKTINGTYFAHIKPLLNWCVEQDFIEVNPAEKVRFGRRKRGERKRDPFSDAQMCAIFGSPAFAADAPRDARFWAVLIGAFQGLRVSEIGQLEVSDFSSPKGIPCIHVRAASDEGESTNVEKSLKTNSERHVPIHPQLIEIGLLDRVEQMRSYGESRLFPEWGPNKRGNFANSSVPRWFSGTFLRSLDIKRKGLAFHSLRHTFKDAARNANIARDRHDYFTGHAAPGVGASYGIAPPASFEALATDIAKIRYEGVDLSHLHTPVKSRSTFLMDREASECAQTP